MLGKFFQKCVIKKCIIQKCIFQLKGFLHFGMATLSCSCKTHKCVFSKQNYYRWWVSLFPKLPIVFSTPLCYCAAASRLLLLLFSIFLFTSYISNLKKKPFEFGRVFDKWKIWRRERERERERRVCWGGGGFVWRKVKEKENKKVRKKWTSGWEKKLKKKKSFGFG